LGQSESLLSDAQFQLTLAMFMRLWRRGYELTHSVVVKATSSVGRLAAPILEADERSRAIYMNVHAEPYLATLLAGQNSPIDLRGHGPERMRRLQSRPAHFPLHAVDRRTAAMSWLAESWTQRDRDGFAGRVVALDFRLPGERGRQHGPDSRHFSCPRPGYLATWTARCSHAFESPEYGYTPDVVRKSCATRASEPRRDRQGNGLARAPGGRTLRPPGS
jgi:hypothetical protein